jgi:hypothetical protein
MKMRLWKHFLTGGNIAALGIDKITNPFFKLAIDESVEFFILPIKFN